MKFYATLFLILISTAVMAQFPVMVSPPDAMKNAPAFLRFSWLPMRMATQYQVNISQDPTLIVAGDSAIVSTSQISVNRIDSRFNTKTDFFPTTPFLLGATYYWHIRATNDTYTATPPPPNADWTDWSSPRSFTVRGDKTVVVSPTNNAKLISTTPRIQWTPVRDAAFYKLYIYTDAALTNLAYQITTTNTYVDFPTSMFYYAVPPLTTPQTIFTYNPIPLTTPQTMRPLLLGQAYYWRVSPFNNDGLTDSNNINSDISTFTSYGAAPLTKVPLNNASITSVQPTFLWTPVKGATQYRFMLTSNADINFNTPLINKKTESFATSYTLTAAQKLQIGRTYRWKVQAINDSTPVADTTTLSSIPLVFKTY